MTALWAVLTVTAPLLAAIVAVVAPQVRIAATFVGIGLMTGGALALGQVMTTSGPTTIALGGWAPPLGIAWRIDGLAVAMLLMTGVVGTIVSLYARSYFADSGSAGSRFYWPLSMVLVASLSALFLSNDLFNWYVTLELLSLSAVALVALAGRSAALKAAQQYLYASLLGSLCYLMGVALIYRTYGTLDLSLLHDLTGPSLPVWVAFALMLSGLLMKSAVFPLHFWLPSAHGSAPAPVSALLSALVVKGSFYILLRLWLAVVPSTPPHVLTSLLGAFGTVAIVWGSIQALRTSRLKLLVAYSTVAQLGYLALFFPLTGNGAAGIALTGVVYFIVAHACAKGAMFLAAGNLQRAAGHDKLAQLTKTAQALPLSMFAFAIGGVSIMGLPPSGGFMAKWTLINAALLNGAWHWIAVMVVGGLLAAAYIFRVLALSFQADCGHSGTADHRQVARSSEWCSLALAAIALLLGLNAVPILELTGIGLTEFRR